jgi:hypothetical protein
VVRAASQLVWGAGYTPAASGACGETTGTWRRMRRITFQRTVSKMTHQQRWQQQQQQGQGAQGVARWREQWQQLQRQLLRVGMWAADATLAAPKGVPLG